MLFMSEPFFILVAEDDENDAWIMQRALQRAKVLDPLLFVNDGQEAINYLSGVGKYSDRKAFPLPSLAIFDIKMPRKTGFEALQWVRQQKNLKSLPVMMLSSSGEQKDIDKAYELGANAYLVKRGQIDELSYVLKQACNFWKQGVSLPRVAKR